MCTSGVAFRFSPAPDYTLHGLVRDQVGEVLPSGQGEIILLQGETVIMRRLITTRGIDENYRLSIPIDQQLFGSDSYLSQ